VSTVKLERATVLLAICAVSIRSWMPRSEDSAVPIVMIAYTFVHGGNMRRAHCGSTICVTLVRNRRAADFDAPPRAQAWIAPPVAAQRLREGAAGFVAGSSAAYRKGHPAGAEWVNRARLDAVIDTLREKQAAVVFGDDDTLASLVAIDLRERVPDAQIECVRGGVAAWRAADLPVDATPQHPADEARIDYLFWAHDRHEGNVAAITKYLQWEEQLPAQIGDAARAGYRLHRPR
jgi:hypothetical protein